MTTTHHEQSRTVLAVHRLGGRIGARIDGVTARRRPARRRPWPQIRAALLEHKVVFFRGQHHLDDDAHIAFAELLGPLTTAHPTVNTGSARILSLDCQQGHGGQQLAHRRHLRRPHPGVQHPARRHASRRTAATPSGPTRSPPTTPCPTRSRRSPTTCGPSTPTTTTTQPRGTRRASEYDETPGLHAEEFRRDVRDRAPGRARAPRDRRALAPARPLRQAASSASRRRVGALFNLLQARVTRLENTVRWSWQQGDVAIWDNRATQHYAVDDYGDQRRGCAGSRSPATSRSASTAGAARSSCGDANAYSRLDELIS